MIDSSELQAAWANDFRGIGGVPFATDLCQRLIERWGEPPRAYHTLQHLQECLGWLERWRSTVRSPERHEVGIALWFHDAVYDPRAHDNEDRSIDLARQDLGAERLPVEVIERVASLIEVTKHSTHSPATPAEKLMVDIDLAILGSPPQRYAEYVRQVRVEYAWVDEEIFRAKRADFLAGVLARSAIFHSPAARHELEMQARDNLAKELRDPRSGSSGS